MGRHRLHISVELLYVQQYAVQVEYTDMSINRQGTWGGLLPDAEVYLCLAAAGDTIVMVLSGVVWCSHIHTLVLAVLTSEVKACKPVKQFCK